MSIRAAMRAVVVVALLASTDLFAHVSLSRSVPAAGSVVHASPAEVRLWFTHAIEARFSTLRILDSAGRQIDKLDKRVDSSDPTLLRISLPRLAPGTYRVHWRAVSIDTHVTTGEFRFTVQP
jgi:methionine-rich copper-binding protein CopC